MRLLILVLVWDVFLAIGVWHDRLSPGPHRPQVAIKIAVGSEDRGLFEDPQAQKDFKTHGYKVTVSPFGSFAIAEQTDLSTYGLVLPSSTTATDALKARVHKQLSDEQLFTSPLVALTWKPLLPQLQTLGIATQSTTDGLWHFDVGAYLRASAQAKKWETPAGLSGHQVLLETTDPELSNSGAMFVGSAASDIDKGAVANTPGQIACAAGVLAPVLNAQGQQKSTTDQLFETYETGGLTGKPLVLSYESEFVGAALAGTLPEDAVMMYLDPEVGSDHSLVALSDNDDARAFTSFLKNDETFQRIMEHTYGFRPLGALHDDFADYMNAHGVPVATDLAPVPTPRLKDLKEIIKDATSPTPPAPPSGCGAP
ncbi:hypothetical protein [Actinacidiphila acididurans]|nr:hypothetical protein [Actinacidiphila acididurans]